MECTEDKNSEIQKIKGLHSALHNQCFAFVLGKMQMLKYPLLKFIKEDCLMGLFGGFGGPNGKGGDCCEMLMLFWLLNSCGCGMNINIDCDTIIWLLLLSNLCGKGEGFNPCH